MSFSHKKTTSIEGISVSPKNGGKIKSEVKNVGISDFSVRNQLSSPRMCHIFPPFPTAVVKTILGWLSEDQQISLNLSDQNPI